MSELEQITNGANHAQATLPVHQVLFIFLVQAIAYVYIGKPFLEHFAEVDIEGDDSYGHDSLAINCAWSTVINEMKAPGQIIIGKTQPHGPPYQRLATCFSSSSRTIIPRHSSRHDSAKKTI